VAVKFAAIGLKGDEFDFCAAKIDADAKFWSGLKTLKGAS